ncbi:aldo/keto reductase [Pseudoalteromonas sp. B28]
MNKRKINGHSVNPIGLGCMNLSHAYGSPPSDEAAINLLHAAIDLGVEHFDTAALYGFGKNEALLGKALAPHRDKIFWRANVVWRALMASVLLMGVHKRFDQQ